MASVGLTSRQGRERSAMPPSLPTLLRSQGIAPDDAPGDALLALLPEMATQPTLVMRCLNPTCPNMCDWSEAKGRLPKFCSARCRQQHAQNRSRLETEIAILNASMARDSTGPRLKRRLNKARAQRLFELYRYTDQVDIQGEEN